MASVIVHFDWQVSLDSLQSFIKSVTPCQINVYLCVLNAMNNSLCFSIPNMSENDISQGSCQLQLCPVGWKKTNLLHSSVFLLPMFLFTPCHRLIGERPGGVLALLHLAICAPCRSMPFNQSTPAKLKSIDLVSLPWCLYDLVFFPPTCFPSLPHAGSEIITWFEMRALC